MLSLRDPADETNDLGRKGIAIKHVQATIQQINTRLRYNVKTNTRHSLLAPLVGHSYMLDFSRRKKLNEHGKKVLSSLQDTLSSTAQAIREAESEQSVVVKKGEAVDPEFGLVGQ
jgi:non-canonical poly(A) RNA polymerase PAPD5/7